MPLDGQIVKFVAGRAKDGGDLMLHTAEPQTQQVSRNALGRTDRVQITWDQVEAYLNSLEDRGRSLGTLSSYRRNLAQFFNALPPDQAVDRDTVSDWQNALLESGYMPRSVNLRLSTVNGFLGFLGLREYQCPVYMDPRMDDVQPEITRNEYLRLLSAVRTSRKRRVYLLIKVFAVLGLNIQELPALTVEAVEAGQMIQPVGRTKRIIRIPTCLRGELLEFVRQEGIQSGPIFITKNGTVISRTAVTALIQRISGEARVAPEKCNPRCLRRLYQTTRENIRANIALLAEQTYDRLLEQEQLIAGWEEMDGL